MKKILLVLGTFFIICGVVFLLIHSFIVTGNPNEPFARDLFGFKIPHPPTWTSYIPYIGRFLGFIFEFFSLHGLVGLIISGIFFCVGGLLVNFSKKDKMKHSKPLTDEEILENKNIPDVIKQEIIKRSKNKA